MEIPADEVRRIAGLARLELDPDFVEPLRQQLAAVVDYVRRLDEADAEPAHEATSGEATLDALREDRPRDPVPREEALRPAPDAERGHFRVPRMLG